MRSGALSRNHPGMPPVNAARDKPIVHRVLHSGWVTAQGNVTNSVLSDWPVHPNRPQYAVLRLEAHITPAAIWDVYSGTILAL
jgi:hypothetical protein